MELLTDSINESTIRQWYDVFKDNNELVEIRIMNPNDKRVYSGYFTDIETLLSEIKKYGHCNIYFTLNVIDDACYSREHRDRIVLKPKSTTSDNEILARKWCLIDIDVDKPSDTNSTNEEKELAKKVANNVYKFLRDQGFEQPVVCDSSNGVHLSLKQAMLSTPENTETMKKFLQVLDMYFSTDKIKIDCSTFNPSRICKLYGTYSRKGSDTEERPQRCSAFVKVPNEIKATKNEYFQKVASYFPQPILKDRSNNYGASTFDLDEFISKQHIQISRKVETSNFTKYVLANCPFNSSHSAPDSAIFKMKDGSFGFKCLHNSCSQYTFRDFRLFYEPDAYSRQRNDNPRQFTPYVKPKQEILKEQLIDDEKGNIWQELDEIEDEDRSKIVSIPSGVLQYDKECCGFDKPSLSVWSGNNGCVDCDTEFFNGTEWVRIPEYDGTSKVLQYNADGTASLVQPIEYHKLPCEDLTLMTNSTGSINQCLSDEHNLVYITSKDFLYKRNFKDFKTSGGCQCRIIPHFKYNGCGIDWSDNEIQLALAISAEGHLFPHRKNYAHRVRINLKHDYKKKELERLLSANGVAYEKKKYNPNDLEYDTYLFYWDKSFKVFPNEWYNMDIRQFTIVKDNITKWDGNISRGRGGCYSTTEKRNADFVQFCVTSINHRCSIKIDNREFRKTPVYLLHFSKNKSMIRCYKDGFIFEAYKTKDGYKYCFTVPSGMLVLRRCGAINITGNSAKSTLLNQIALNAVNKGFKVAIYSGELRGKKIKRWLLYQAAGKSYNVKSQYNDYDYYTPQNVKDKIVSWLRGKLYNYNTKYSHNIQQVCKEVENIIKEKQIDMVVMDNLSCLDIEDLDGTINEQQKAAIKMVLRLANEYNVALHIVVHPKKSTSWLVKEDVSGSKTITDLADNVFLCQRWNLATQKAAKEYLPISDYDDICSSGATNLMQVIKHREFGDAENHIYKLYFETESKRLKNSVAEHIVYNWEEIGTQQKLNIVTDNNYSSYNNYYPNNSDFDDLMNENVGEVPF